MTKRNIDLSRDILIEIEKIDFSDGNAYFLSGVIDDIAEALNSSDVEYHFRLLEDNGFIRVAAPPPPCRNGRVGGHPRQRAAGSLRKTT
jgi:hypothetical protein